MSTLRFLYDVVCPFAYVASTQVRAIAEEAGIELEYCPVLLGGIYGATGGNQDPGSAMPAAKARLNRLDAHRQAARAGAPFRYNSHHPRRTVTAMRLLHACAQSERPALTDALFRAYWVKDQLLDDRGVLQQIAAPFGLDVAAVDADPKVRRALFDATDQAVAIGAFGVPTLQLGDQIWWGADRLHFVREALGLPRHAPAAGSGGPHTVAFFHDFSSPFSYLASTQIEAVCAASGAALERVPFLLGALFKQIGTPMIPLHSFVAARQDQQLADLEEWARWYGVRFQWPSRFPIRSVTALRAAIVDPRATDPLYRAAWVEDRDLSDPDVIRGVLNDAGLDGAAALEGVADPTVKSRLFANTERAHAVGACGAPSFLVDDTQLFWGQDRLAMVADALAGRGPPGDVA